MPQVLACHLFTFEAFPGAITTAYQLECQLSLLRRFDDIDECYFRLGRR